MSDSLIKLLLIEDSPELTRMIRQMLAQEGNSTFAVESAADLSQGLLRLASGGIDLVLLDLLLPDCRGLDSLYRLRAQAADLPLVVLTALEDENMALTALREGAQDYLIKGEINRRLLVRAIRFALERKRGEETRSRLAAIVESSQDAIIGMSLEGLIVSWNPGAQTIFGHSFEDVIGRPLAFLALQDQPDAIPEILQRVKSGEFIKDFEALRQHKEGRPIHVAISISPIKNSVGKIIGASMIARDVDERKRAEAERELLIRQLQTALAQVNTLNGLLPICASCKKIRDDKGYWTQVEVYVKERSLAEFSHGICPDCLQKYKADMIRKF